MKKLVKSNFYPIGLLVFCINTIISNVLGSDLRPVKCTNDRCVKIILPLQTRTSHGEIVIENITVNSSELAIIVMDMWNSHWDGTYTNRNNALVPDMNQFLHNARDAGAVIIFSPTNLMESKQKYNTSVYLNTRQRIMARSLPTYPLLPVKQFTPDEPLMWRNALYHMDGRAIDKEAQAKWQLTSQTSGLDIEPSDYMIGDLRTQSVQELWNVVREHGVKYILYVGGALHWCLYHKPIGVRDVKTRGMQTVLVRDLVIGWSDPYHWYDRTKRLPETFGFSFDKADSMMIAWYERNGISATVPNSIFPRTHSVHTLKLQNATAVYSEEGFEADKTIDNSPLPGNGWSNKGNIRRENILVCEVASEWGNTIGQELVFIFDFFSHIRGHGLGRFRISATTDKRSEYADNQPNNGDVTANWEILDPCRAYSLDISSMIQIQPDQSLLVKTDSGMIPNFDRYVIHAKNPDMGEITGFRIEILTSDTLPERGPGLAPNGNFVLNELIVRTVGFENRKMK